MNIIEAKNFSSRSELENEVRGKLGLTPDRKLNYEIQGTRDELSRLQLSDRNIFWGILCVITDTPSIPKKQSDVEIPERGKIEKFGLNISKIE